MRSKHDTLDALCGGDLSIDGPPRQVVRVQGVDCIVYRSVVAHARRNGCLPEVMISQKNAINP